MILSAGTMLQDRYEILEKIGSGGMSDVYKAKCHKLNRLVAIKVLKSEFNSDAGFIAKFKMEAQAAAALSHPNIGNIYDVVDEGNLHFIVMELVEGITLKSYIRKKGHLDVKETIGIAIQVAQGIEAAHEQHIIHRDIKPQNMLISKDGKVKVADFGIARAVSAQTMNSMVVGSVHYISPEQARAGLSDERSDIYSLGITMFEMVTGRLPFEGDNTVTVALAHLEEPIALPRTINPDITPGLERIILKCTEKKPENRYQNIASVISDLRRSLLNSDDPTVGVIEPSFDEKEESEPLSDTRPISRQELDIITGRSEMPRELSRDIKNGNISRNSMDAKPALEEYPSRKGILKHKQESDDAESTGIEKLFSVLGVFAAILVVAAAVVFFSKIGGLFAGGSDKETVAVNTTESTEEKVTQTTEESISQKEVKMPKVEGLSQEQAEQLLGGMDLTMHVTLENSETIPKGIVISQENAPDSIVARYSKVEVTISSGSDKIDLASLGITQMALDTAVRLLEGKGVRTSVVEESSDEIPAGDIVRMEPEDKAAVGDTVTLYVSTGPEEDMVPVPKLVGESEDRGAELLNEAGLLVGEISKAYSDEIPAGKIAEQGIDSEEQVEKGTAVDYVVSLGPEKPKTQFLASLEVTYPLLVSFGPGAASSEIQILIRLKQTVNGKVTYTKLTEPKSYSASTNLDIRLDKIRGADGVQTGEVEIVDLTNNVVLTSYNVNFVETEV